MPICASDPASEEYADFIVQYASRNPMQLIERARTECISFISSTYAVVHVPLDRVAPMSIYRYSYNAIPKLYGLLDTTALESSGIPEALNRPNLQASGEGVILGIIDTGIDYTNPLFRHADGSTRILSIWDQSIFSGVLPENMDRFRPFYGSVYSQEQINDALAQENPFETVPTRDSDGHGTFLAGVAAGRALTQPVEFSGAAPDVQLAIVKLKPAKQYLRDFFLIPSGVSAFQENDIMSGVRFLQDLAATYQRPLVILLGVGTSQGNHDGSSPLGFQLRALRGVVGVSIVTGAGNEVGYHHHFLGSLNDERPSEDVELRVAQDDPGFCLEFWANGPELYTIGFHSPSGEIIDQIPLALGNETVVPFRLDATRITVNYQLYEAGSGNQLIFMRFQTPMHGIWHIRVRPVSGLRGQFHMWLPMHPFVADNTIFLRPNPDTTITDPGNVPTVLTAAAYNHVNNSIYIHSSRGYSSDGLVKPDLAAPGVEVQGPAVSTGTGAAAAPASGSDALRFTRRTGTSVAAAIAAGAAADILSWSITGENNPTATGLSVKSQLIRGADRNPSMSYPNREWGYGTLNLYRSFTIL